MNKFYAHGPGMKDALELWAENEEVAKEVLRSTLDVKRLPKEIDIFPADFGLVKKPKLEGKG